ncbi:MAG: aspartate aminotransferase family protein [Lachnospiraceae bacterium]|nr:aspartate aminotransferase family protein [Lachnospiraceae bacterium]
MTANEYMSRTEEYVLHTYNRFPVVFDHGKGVRLYDTDGKEYLDFAAGIAVYALGYGNQKYNDALKDQIDRIIHTSNLYYHVPLMEAAERIVKKSGMAKVFFSNSGAEAIEGAIKTARKYAYLKDGKTDHEIIAMNASFHGRSVGALSVTGNPHYQEAFRPLMGGVEFADFNDYDSVLSKVNDRTCAILMETVQGEGGIYPADEKFLRQVRQLCDERDILLILDEIQCGMGRTGDWFAYQGYGIMPDIMTSAKALGCGIPVGAFLMNEKVAKASLVPGDHGTTYGGNPLATRAAATVIDLFDELDLISHVREIAPYLEQTLDGLMAEFGFLTERRGKGLMQGVVVRDVPVGKIVSGALENGLVILSAGSDVIRLVPPLVITKDDIDEMAVKLRATLASF